MPVICTTSLITANNNIYTKATYMHSDFDSGKSESYNFFCMKLLFYINRDKKDYNTEMNNAASGNCSFKKECPIYAATMKKQGLQTRLIFNL